MKTKVCEQLGIEVPIFGFSHCRDVVVAVSAAGGLGCAWCDHVSARATRGRTALAGRATSRQALWC